LKRWLEREDESTREWTVKALIGQLTMLLATHRHLNVLRMLVRLRHSPLVATWTVDRRKVWRLRAWRNSPIISFA
jgi:hypothetical protein